MICQTGITGKSLWSYFLFRQTLTHEKAYGLFGETLRGGYEKKIYDKNMSINSSIFLKNS